MDVIRLKIGSGDHLLLLLEKRYGVEVPTATMVRKGVSTVGAQKLTDDKVRLRTVDRDCLMMDSFWPILHCYTLAP